MCYGPTHARCRQVSDGIVKGVHFLMKKNKIEEIDGWGTLTSPTSMDVALNDGSTRQLTFDHLIIAAGAVDPDAARRRGLQNVVTYEEQILDENLPGSIIIAGSGAIGVEFAYVMKNFGVDVTIVEFLDRMVPTEDADISKELAQALQEARREGLLGTKVEGVEDTGSGVRVTVSPGGRRRPAGARGRQVPLGHRLRAAHRGLRPRGDRRRAHRPRRRRHRRVLPHQRAQRLRHRRLHGQADARPRRRGPGHRRRRDPRRRRHDAGRLRLRPARHLLPPADRLVRLLRGAGQGEGLRRQDRHVPVHRQRQGDGPRRRRGLRQGRRRRRRTTRSSART